MAKLRKKEEGKKKRSKGGRFQIKSRGKRKVAKSVSRKERETKEQFPRSEKEIREKRKHDHSDDGTPKKKRPKIVSTSRSTDKGKKKVVTMRRERDTTVEMKETIKKAKNLWEKLRRHDLQKETRSSLLTELMSLIKHNLYEFVKKHDTARIIQCMLRFGAVETRTAVFETLKDHVVDLSKMKYAKFVVKALFKYCNSSQRNILISMLYNNVQRLVKHTEASEIVELAYNEYANASQRSLLVQEFYGPQFALFKDNGGRGLGEILAANPDQSTKLIGHMKQALLPLMHKAVVKHSIVHKAVLDFMQYADEQSRSEVTESMREVVVEMLHTREGAKVALNCLWHGNAKNRKVLVKSFKGYVSKICKEEHGHLVLMGIFDCVDDTVLIGKTLFPEIVSSLNDLCSDRYGRRVLLYLLCPRSPQHFSNQFLEILKPGDNNTHSKKPQDTRWVELCSSISLPLISLAAEKAVEWACDKSMAPLLIQIVLSAKGDVTPIYKSLVEGLESSSDKLVCDPCGHWVLKRLLKIESSEGQHSFASIVLDKVGDQMIYSWTDSNRGCFVLSSLMANKDSRTRAINILRPFIGQLRGSRNINEGSKVLLKSFDNISCA